MKKHNDKEEIKCAWCGEVIELEENDSPYLDKQDRPVCDPCVESEDPDATVYYDNDSDPEYVYQINESRANDDFECKYIHTDGWRGYMSVSSKTYTKVRDDAILFGSSDAASLKQFDDLMRKYCDEQSIRYARVFTETSNVFCQGYDFFVHNEDVEKFENLSKLLAKVSELVEEYRDSSCFTLTCLTGKDSFDEHDKKLLHAYDLIKEGKGLEEVMEEVLADDER